MSQPSTETKDASGMETEFVPVQGGYGFERVRLRIEPAIVDERTPPAAQPRAAVPHEYGSEVHANLG